MPLQNIPPFRLIILALAVLSTIAITPSQAMAACDPAECGPFWFKSYLPSELGGTCTGSDSNSDSSGYDTSNWLYGYTWDYGDTSSWSSGDTTWIYGDPSSWSSGDTTWDYGDSSSWSSSDTTWSYGDSSGSDSFAGDPINTAIGNVDWISTRLSRQRTVPSQFFQDLQ